MMKKMFLVATLALSFTAACGKSKIDQAISAEEDFKDKMCACTDKDCTDKVHKEEREWQKAHKDDISEDDLGKLSGSQIEKMMKIDKEERECRKKFDK